MQTDIDLAQYIAELKTPWKTMSSDMDTALSIINKYTRTESSIETVELFSISDNEHETEISFPEWHIEVENVFIDQYGRDSGKQIFNKVIMRLYLLARGKAQHLH
ncbi:MAG: hypothetical protein OEY07_12115 [Gammaproteobacteria bacterium]|nr:hypothetical protein [Gammaproteobacteria bacterium]